MPITDAAQLIVGIVDEVSHRAPAIAAAAAYQIPDITIGLHFGDGSHAAVRSQQSRLISQVVRVENADVEVFLDNRSTRLLSDLSKYSVDLTLMHSLDVRGERKVVLACWRAFHILANRALGLRAVHELMAEYRDLNPHLRDLPGPRSTHKRAPKPPDTGWRSVDFLTHSLPEDDIGHRCTVGDTVLPKPRALWDGRSSRPWWHVEGPLDADLLDTLQRCKTRVQEEIQRIVPEREPRAALYDLIHDYPSRGGKGLRPTLTIASCCAFGGRSEEGVRVAAAIELFHNAFLIHDDIADQSTYRRNRGTLHEIYGLGLAVNTGDAMNLLAIDTILSNLSTLGLATTLRLIHETLHMARETIEGQAIELGWIREGVVPPHVEDYFHMCTKKTSWYTLISPCRLGAICAGETDNTKLDAFNEPFRLIGIAFQIQDDLLNLIGETALYGKEPLGDLLESKRTVMLIHLFREADPVTRERLSKLIGLPRSEMTDGDANEIFTAMQAFGSIDFAKSVADDLSRKGMDLFEDSLAFLPESEAKGILRQIAAYVITRVL